MLPSVQEAGDDRPVRSLKQKELDQVLLAHVTRLNQARPQRNTWEVIAAVHVLLTSLSQESGTLTQTMKVVRPAVRAQFKQVIDALLERMR